MDKLAKSLAGHDRDHVYVVIREEEGYVYLADGKGKTLERPKKKKRRHVQLITHLPEEYAALLGSAVRDSDLVHILRRYHSAACGQQQK